MFPTSRPSDRLSSDDAPAPRRAPFTPPEVTRPERAADAELADHTLGELLVAMRSEVEAVREAAWAACYARYHRVVWTRAFYVMRSVAWLAEPREAAADVASDVFVGLPDAARCYREEGRAEWWLKQIAVRTALRRKEALTGRWASGRKVEAPAGAGQPAAGGAPDRGRSYMSFDETANEIITRLDAVEHDELLELERRRAALRASHDAQHRRWDEFLALYVAGYDFREIGAHMGITEGTARNWLCKIRKHLGQSLDASGADASTPAASPGRHCVGARVLLGRIPGGG